MSKLKLSSPQIFEESGLTFRFAPDISVISYDKHRFFRAISGAGLRGVDFLGLWPGGRLTLIEVKHYRHPLGQGLHPAEKILQNSAPLIEAVVRKVEDTLRGIEVAQAYLQRKWHYRLWLRWRRRLPFLETRAPEWSFWTALANTLHGGGRLQVILWLEADDWKLDWERVGELEAGLRRALEDRLPGREVSLALASGKRSFPGIFLNG